MFFVGGLGAVLIAFSLAPEDVDGELIWRSIAIGSGAIALLGPTIVVVHHELHNAQGRMSWGRSLALVSAWTIAHVVVWLVVMSVFVEIMSGGML